MQKTYIDTVRLLLDAAPEVFRGGVFAMKGGTAINLFVHDMPRLSVDIDLVYPDWSASRADALRAIADEFAAIAAACSESGSRRSPCARRRSARASLSSSARIAAVPRW